MNIRVAHLRFVEKRNVLLFLLTFLVSISFLAGFGIYIRRKVRPSPERPLEEC